MNEQGNNKPQALWRPGVISYEEDFITLAGEMTYAEVKEIEHRARIAYMAPENEGERAAVLSALVREGITEIGYDPDFETDWEKHWGR